jgi:hypothetical protein
MNEVQQILSFSTGLSIILALVIQIWRMEKWIYQPLREENARLRVIHLEAVAERAKCHEEREECALERQGMRIFMRAYGIEYDPGDLTVKSGGKKTGEEGVT